MRFKSLTRTNICYKMDNNHDWNYRANNTLSDNIYEYDTYGDGDTQHSSEILTDSNNVFDFLYSFGSHLIENPDAVKEIEEYSLFWYVGISNKDIDFYLSLKYNPDKKQYYCDREYKISSSEKKSYDKRWEEMPSWADASPTSCYRFMSQKAIKGLNSLILMYEIEDRYNNNFGWNSDIDCQFYKKEYPNYKYDLRSAFYIVDKIISAYRGLKSAKNSLECLTSNLANRKKNEEIKNG